MFWMKIIAKIKPEKLKRMLHILGENKGEDCHEKNCFTLFRRYVYLYAGKKMQAAAEAENYACEIAAYPMAEAGDKAADADVVLLGPQVSFNLAKVKSQLPGKPVDAIEMRMYGRMDGKGVLACARKLMGE